MTTEFTLHLSPEAIILAARQTDDQWENVITTAPAADDLSEAFARMKALISQKKNAQLLLVIPREQVLFTTCPAPSIQNRAAEIQAVETRLDGLTPYPLDELRYDWVRHGPLLQIAAIAQETIEDANTFVSAYGINAAALTVETRPNEYDGAPVFGLHTQASVSADRAKIGPRAIVPWRLLDFIPARPRLKPAPLALGGAVAALALMWMVWPDQPSDNMAPTAAPEVIEARTPPEEPVVVEAVEPPQPRPEPQALPAPEIALAPTIAPLTLPRTVSDRVRLDAIDPIVPQQDALALRPPQGGTGSDLPAPILSPLPFGTGGVLNAAGLVDPSPEGTLNPEGVLIIAGAPAVAAIPRPDAIVETARAAIAAIAETQAALANTPPRLRPENFAEILERQRLNGFTRAELAAFIPRLRPASLQEIAEATHAAEAAAAAVSAGRTANQALISDLALARSLLPQARPAGFEAVVAAAQPATPAAPSGVAAEAAAQSGADAEIEAEIAAISTDTPSGERVTRAATNRNAINLRNTNLIGVTGSSNNRRALVRLASGRFVTVEVGDRLDGGRVAAIDDDSLQYIKDGQNITLEVPNG
ncbi:hypothetical protein OE810_02735 [Rhodobacteraceae bacterium XHP0102]|nr:hypothetical protein [Rhodobacteraceae bacterium XHP0102]